MRSMRLAAVAVTVAVGIGLLFVGASAAQMKVPADFTFDQGKDSPGKVTFSHEAHKAKLDKCTACHTKVFKMKKGTSGELTKAAMKEGKLCGACHNGTTEVGGDKVFAVSDEAACGKCHQK